MSAVVDAISDVVGGAIEVVGDAVESIADAISDNPLLLAAAAIPFIGPGVATMEGAALAGAEGAALAGAEGATFGGLGLGTTLELGGLDAMTAAASAMAGSAPVFDFALGGLGGLGGMSAIGEMGLGAGLAGGLGSLGEGIGSGLSAIGNASAEYLSGLGDSSLLGDLTNSWSTAFGEQSITPELASNATSLDSFAAPSAFESAIGNVSKPMTFLDLPYQSGQYLASQIPAPVVESVPIPVSEIAGAEFSTMHTPAPWATAEAASDTAGKLWNDFTGFLKDASNTPAAKTIKTAGNVLNLANTAQNMYNNYQTMQQQKQLMDAQLEAYRTAGQQSASPRQAGSFAPNQAFGYHNYAGQFGIKV